MADDVIKLSDLIDMEDTAAVLAEVKTIVHMLDSDFDFEPIDQVFSDIVTLFSGRYPGYRACNTKYHDLAHTTDIFLAMARLIHGAVEAGQRLETRRIALGLISSLMHDTGYIQEVDDLEGTGAKYTQVHIERSIEFMRQYFIDRAYASEEFESCKNALLCTGLSAKIDEIPFRSEQDRLLGRILGTSDLVGQMADRNYLEKLYFLYHEFKEGNIPGYESEFDLFNKTISFHEVTKKRFQEEFDGVNQFMRFHFRSRWNVDKDLYEEAIERHMAYVKTILEKYGPQYYTALRRGGVFKSLNLKALP